MDLITFLNARLDEDETAARAAAPGPWEFEGDDPTDDELFAVSTGNPVAFTRGPSVQNGQHMARHDPVRVLREVAAKRAILAEHRLVLADLGDPYTHKGGEWAIARDDPSPAEVAMANTMQWILSCKSCRGSYPCATVCHMAAVYSDHADYQTEWAPQPLTSKSSTE